MTSADIATIIEKSLFLEYSVYKHNICGKLKEIQFVHVHTREGT